MQTTRRSFGKLVSGGALALAMGETLMGLSCSSVYADILKYVPVGLSAFASVLSILSGGGVTIAPVVATIVALVNAGFADLQAVVTAYDAAPAANKATLLGKISTALASVEANLQGFWSNLTIPDTKLESIVQGLLGIITTTLLGFGTQLPAPSPTPALMARGSLRRTIAGTPTKRSVKQFRNDFNAILKQNGMSEHAI